MGHVEHDSSSLQWSMLIVPETVRLLDLRKTCVCFTFDAPAADVILLTYWLQLIFRFHVRGRCVSGDVSPARRWIVRWTGSERGAMLVPRRLQRTVLRGLWCWLSSAVSGRRTTGKLCAVHLPRPLGHLWCWHRSVIDRLLPHRKCDIYWVDTSSKTKVIVYSKTKNAFLNFLQ